MAEEIRILVAEDQPVFRDGVRDALRRNTSLRLVAEASDGLAAFECVKALNPDIAIVDIGMPKMDGVGLVRRIREERISIEIIFVTVCKEEEMLEAALELGVKGYLLKSCTGDEIVDCVQAVAAGQYYVSPAMTDLVIRRFSAAHGPVEATGELDDPRLTFQEREVFKRVAEHKSSKEIAQDMAIAPRTVETHRFNICKKLGIHGNYGLSRFAARRRKL